MAFDVLIPARLASTRLPGKPLADIGGVPMIVRVARRAARSGANRVMVAADDVAIMAACASHGVKAVLTGSHHASGSDRLAEACTLLDLDGDDVVVNVQGDEPMLDPALVDACAALLVARADCVMSTVAHPIADVTDFADPHVVKVVLDADARALYFSRAPVPWPRDAGPGRLPASAAPLQHVGVYAYRAAFLRGFAALRRSPLEDAEQLEQLRVLWHGHRIAVHVAAGRAGIGIDTPADLARARTLFESDGGAGFA